MSKNEYYSECELNKICFDKSTLLECICANCSRDCAYCSETTDTIPRGKGCLFVCDGVYKSKSEVQE